MGAVLSVFVSYIIKFAFTPTDHVAQLEYQLASNSPHGDLKEVAKVKELFIHPIKSCRGISVKSAECTPLGLKSGALRDRVFMIVEENGHFLTSRQEPLLLKVTPSIHDDNELWLNAPGKETLKLKFDELNQLAKQNTKTCKVWGQEALGIDCGNQVSEWFSKHINRQVRLVYYSNVLRPKFCHVREKLRPLVKETDAAAFADFSCYMMMSQTSVDDLNEKLKRKVVMRRFRPNIVIDSSPCYSEDTWKEIQINEVWFRNVKPCQRCVMIVTDPETGIRDEDSEALNVLRTYRKATDPEIKKFTGESPLLGINLGIDRTGIISVGDTVYASFKTES